MTLHTITTHLLRPPTANDYYGYADDYLTMEEGLIPRLIPIIPLLSMPINNQQSILLQLPAILKIAEKLKRMKARPKSRLSTVSTRLSFTNCW